MIIRRSVFALYLIVLVFALSTSLGRAASLVLEAEDFRVRSGDWKVGDITQNYYSGTFANTFLYWSRLFGIDKDIEKLAKRTRIVEKILGPGVYTEANFSPHSQYWPRFGQWVRLFRKRGMTMPWSEDYIWQIPELSPQVTGEMGGYDYNPAKTERRSAEARARIEKSCYQIMLGSVKLLAGIVTVRRG